MVNNYHEMSEIASQPGKMAWNLQNKVTLVKRAVLVLFSHGAV